MKKFLWGFLFVVVGVVGGNYLASWTSPPGSLKSPAPSNLNVLFIAWVSLGTGFVVFWTFLKIQDVLTDVRTGKRRSHATWSLLMNGYLACMMLSLTVLSLVVVGLSLLSVIAGAMFLLVVGSLLTTVREMKTDD